MLSELRHPGLMPMLGYCVRSEEVPTGNGISQHGVVAIYPKADVLTRVKMRAWTLQQRLEITREIADLFEYFEHSPLGSLRMNDLKDTNFMLLDGHIKISDYDDVSSEEPRCGKYAEGRQCLYGVQCDQGLCQGENARSNMVNANKVFFSQLLSCKTCRVKEEIHALKGALKAGTVTAFQLRSHIDKIMINYAV